MKTLVTGATGFVGKHLVKRLVTENKNVACLVRSNNIASPLKQLGVELIYGDLRDRLSISELKKHDIDVIYHLAGAVYSRHNTTFNTVNTAGTKNLLQHGIGETLQKFIYLSSIAVNGFPPKNTLISENSPCIPFTPYGKSKLLAEQLITDFFNNTHIATVILRAPVIYGPDGQSTLLTDNFLKIARGKAVIIGDGSNMRSLCYVDNLIGGLIAAKENAEKGIAVYVISDQNSYSVMEIINTISKVCNVTPRKIYLPSFVADCSRIILNALYRCGRYSWKLYSIATMNIDLGCDITKARQKIGYNPTVNLKTGIKETLSFHQVI